MTTQNQLDQILDSPASKKKGKPISFITVDKEELVLSRYGDDVIDLSPYIDTPGVAKKIHLNRFPRCWRFKVLDLLIAYWRHGIPGSTVPKATTVISRSIQLCPFVQWANSKGLKSFSEIRPIHIRQFTSAFSKTHAPNRKESERSEDAIAQTLTAVSLAWRLREYVNDSLPVPPFGVKGTPGRSVKALRLSERKLKTNPIELVLASKLYVQCLELIAAVPKNLDDLRRIDELKQKQPRCISSQDFSRVVQSELEDLYGRRREISKNLSMARIACFALIGLLTGMRCHEILLLERNCWRESTWNGTVLGWIRGRTLKQKHGERKDAEWIAPLNLKPVVATLCLLANRPRAILLESIAVMERKMALKSISPSIKASLANKLRVAKESVDLLFLLSCRKATEVEYKVYVWDRQHLFWAIHDLGRSVGIDHLHPHALRRTFAVIVVHICGGDIRYMRVQFKHWSVDTTIMYAQHDKRDQELVDEIAEEMLEYKTDLIAHWLNPQTPLAAPGGNYIKAQRVKPAFRGVLRENPRELARGLAQDLIIRPTGHSTCVSTGEMSCGGAGLYDAQLCAGCDQAVAEEKHETIWELIGAQALEFEKLNEEGPVFAQLVKRSLASVDTILRNLGSSLDIVRQKYLEAAV